MAAFQQLRSQTWALIRKNFTVVVVRRWISTLIRAGILPILFLTLILCIPEFTKESTIEYGMGSPHPIISLADSMGSKPLVIYLDPGLGPDIEPVVETLTKDLNDDQVVYIESQSDVNVTCPVDFDGVSPCHAVVLFNDSPLSGKPEARWNYTMRYDPAAGGYYGRINVYNTDNALDQLFLPLQLAIDNAITNSTDTFDAMLFTSQSRSPEEAETQAKQNFQMMALFILNFVFYVILIPAAHHIAGTICREREIGICHLIDAMGGGATWSRILSNVLFFDALYLPLWFVLAGCK